jgi:hypothetical protein
MSNYLPRHRHNVTIEGETDDNRYPRCIRCNRPTTGLSLCTECVEERSEYHGRVREYYDEYE